jgi:hypothetical protein
LRFHDANFESCLFDIIQHDNIRVIEFQLGPLDYFEKLNINRLKKYCRIGCTVHEKKRLPINILKKLHYSNFVSNFIHESWPQKHIQYNGIILYQPVWRFLQQKEALHISRFTKEKLPTIKAFIQFCLQVNIVPVLAGPTVGFQAENIIHLLMQEYGQHNLHFIGTIHTISYLQEHVTDFLFVGGVGQVSQEAASLGFPSFVCSHCGLPYSTFLTSKNFESLRLRNFTIQNPNSNIVIDQRLPSENTCPLPTELLQKISFNNLMEQYRQIIQL